VSVDLVSLNRLIPVRNVIIVFATEWQSAAGQCTRVSQMISF